jgi:hypothetical protein
MTLPSVSVEDFLARFPEFEEAGEERIALALTEAVNYVSDEWAVEHLPMAIMLLAAHFIYAESTLMFSLKGNLSGQATAGPIVSKSIGPLSTTYANTLSTLQRSSGQGSDLGDSPYGQRFLTLMRVNFPPVLVII